MLKDMRRDLIGFIPGSRHMALVRMRPNVDVRISKENVRCDVYTR